MVQYIVHTNSKMLSILPVANDASGALVMVKGAVYLQKKGEKMCWTKNCKREFKYKVCFQACSEKCKENNLYRKDMLLGDSDKNLSPLSFYQVEQNRWFNCIYHYLEYNTGYFFLNNFFRIYVKWFNVFFFFHNFFYFQFFFAGSTLNMESLKV